MKNKLYFNSLTGSKLFGLGSLSSVYLQPIPDDLDLIKGGTFPSLYLGCYGEMPGRVLSLIKMTMVFLS